MTSALLSDPDNSVLRGNAHTRGRGGFSLVEVTVSIGIVTFCLLALIGLLPVGLDAVKGAREEAAAANALEMIAGSIRQAAVTNTNEYKALGAFSNKLTWTYGQSNVSKFDTTNELLPLSMAGIPVTNSADAKDERLVAYVSLQAPSAENTGNALLTVAWPKSAKWTNNAWTNAQGSVSTWMVFLAQ